MGAMVSSNVPIAKGAVCYALDKVSRGPQAKRRLKTLRDAIARTAPSYKGLADAFDKHLLRHVFTGAAARGRIVAHLKESWFEGRKYFPGKPVARIYGEGLRKTLDLSLKGRGGKVVPIDAWWSLDHAEVKMMNLAEVKGGKTVGSHVTLLIHTPRPKGKGKPSSRPILGDTAQAHVTHSRGTHRVR